MSVAAEPVADSGEAETIRNRPVATFKQSGVEVTIWKNPAPNGDVFNTTIRNSYKVDKADEWKQTDNFTPTDLAVLAQLSGQAFQEIVRLKQQSKSKPAEAAPQ